MIKQQPINTHYKAKPTLYPWAPIRVRWLGTTTRGSHGHSTIYSNSLRMPRGFIPRWLTFWFICILCVSCAVFILALFLPVMTRGTNRDDVMTTVTTNLTIINIVLAETWLVGMATHICSQLWWNTSFDRNIFRFSPKGQPICTSIVAYATGIIFRMVYRS